MSTCFQIGVIQDPDRSGLPRHALRHGFFFVSFRIHHAWDGVGRNGGTTWHHTENSYLRSTSTVWWQSILVSSGTLPSTS